MNNYLICCDWGTSSLRIRLVDTNHHIIDQEVSDQGTAFLFETWRRAAIEPFDLNNRVAHYLGHIQLQLDKLASRNNLDLDGLPVVISGMASSSIGMVELPYAELPFSIDGDHAIVQKLNPSKPFNHPVILLSGVRDGDEVMRGEETQLVGIAGLLEASGHTDKTIVILPGTHSKHVHLSDRHIAKIVTYVTGELFANLSKNGLLKEAVQPTNDKQHANDWETFKSGVDDSGTANILNALFKVRTNQLFGRFSKQQNYQYLSGLLIGYEIRNLVDKRDMRIVLCSSANLYDHYIHAMSYLELGDRLCHLDPKDVESATVKGQIKIASHYLNKS